MEITIVIHKPYGVITRIAHSAADINNKVYETLTKYGIDEIKAIDCASWCELASYGESYNEDNFSVYIEEE
jgi:hypothetical protein